MTATPAQFVRDALQNGHNRTILDRMARLGLPDAWLVAGCLFQTIWNQRTGAPPQAQIKDYDLFYFDAADLSEPAEAAVNARVQACFADLAGTNGMGVAIEAKNQARVHTWYESYFGHPYAPLRSSREGIDRFLVRCTCVGLQPGPTGPLLYAPNGLDDLYEGLLAPNPLCDHRQLFERKAAAYQARWPWLRVVAGAQPLASAAVS